MRIPESMQGCWTLQQKTIILLIQTYELITSLFNCFWWKFKRQYSASQSSARILCSCQREEIGLGHGVGIYTSVIVQPLRGIPSCMYLFAFMTEAYNITWTKPQRANAFLLVSTSATVTPSHWQQVSILMVFVEGRLENIHQKAKKPTLTARSAKCVKMGIWVMGTGLLVDAVHNVAKAFTTNLWCGYAYFPPRHETRLSSLYVLHVRICKRNHASAGALFKGTI